MLEKYVTDAENKLYKAGIKQYQTEDSLIAFIKKCKQGLCFTEIEYFERVIPDNVIDAIEKADALEVFDNYYILYYDAAKAKNIYAGGYTIEKDPIVFGVIRGTKKLYYIADWIDEYCNLTYADILKTGTDFKIKKNK